MLCLVDIVSSRRKAEIFRLLFGGTRSYHLRELARQSGLALRTVQQEAERLAEAGLVTARRDGNRVYYEANEHSPVFGELRSIVLKTAGLANVLQETMRVPGVELAFVFGSIASNTAKPQSDIDLMVIGTIGFRRLAQLLSGTAEKLGREINPHILTTEEFKRRRQTDDHFIASVLSAPRLFLIGSENELAQLGK